MDQKVDQLVVGVFFQAVLFHFQFVVASFLAHRVLGPDRSFFCAVRSRQLTTAKFPRDPIQETRKVPPVGHREAHSLDTPKASCQLDTH